MILYIHKKCSTCKNALLFLKKHGVPFTEKEISKEPPSIEELQQMLDYQKGNLKKLFNTSGFLYKEMELKENLQNLSVNEALVLLNKQGMLVKRPFLIANYFGLLGFKENEWSQKIGRSPV